MTCVVHSMAICKNLTLGSWGQGCLFLMILYFGMVSGLKWVLSESLWTGAHAYLVATMWILVKIPDVSEHEWFLTEWSVGADSFNSSASSKHRCANVFLNVYLPMAQLLSKKWCSVHISFREIRNTTKEAWDASWKGPELPRSPYLELLIPWRESLLHEIKVLLDF